MKLKTPFGKKQTIWQTITNSWPFISKQAKQKAQFEKILNFLLYISIFLAGFTIAKIHTLLSLIN